MNSKSAHLRARIAQHQQANRADVETYRDLRRQFVTARLEEHIVGALTQDPLTVEQREYLARIVRGEQP